jgi:hypothetical protein
VPAEVDRVVVRTAEGAVHRAEIRGEWFAFGAPEGGLAGVVVEAYDGSRRVAEGPPTMLLGELTPAAFTDACDRTVAAALSRLEWPLAGLPALMTVTESPGVWLRFYGSGDYRGQCTRDPFGPVDLQIHGPGGPGEPPMPPLAFMGHPVDYQAWVQGVAPAGATSVTLHLASGRRVPATVRGGSYIAVWRNAEVRPDIEVVRVTAESPDTSYEWTPDGGLITR